MLLHGKKTVYSKMKICGFALVNHAINDTETQKFKS